MAEGQWTGRVCRGHRCRSARCPEAFVGNRRHNSGPGKCTRGCPCGKAGTGARRRAGDDHQSLRPRRQGHADGRTRFKRRSLMRSASANKNVESGRIALKFAQVRGSKQSALIPFIVAGDPDLERTQRLVLELETRGADLIELGVPFSDPMADGPAILALVAELRKHTQIPIILFGYFNPIFRYGCERLCADAKRAGVDGLLVVDLPPEEALELAVPARVEGLDLIYLLAP